VGWGDKSGKDEFTVLEVRIVTYRAYTILRKDIPPTGQEQFIQMSVRK